MARVSPRFGKGSSDIHVSQAFLKVQEGSTSQNGKGKKHDPFFWMTVRKTWEVCTKHSQLNRWIMCIHIHYAWENDNYDTKCHNTVNWVEETSFRVRWDLGEMRK